MSRILIVAFVLFSSGQLQAKTQKINLQKALNLKLVTTKIISLGGYQGFCMSMELKNLSKDSLIITIEAGRKLNSIDEKLQDILITKEEIIAIQSKASRCVVLKGYCCQSSNNSPVAGAKYDVNNLADVNLLALAEYLNKNNFDANLEQQAVWAISDKKSTANITSVNDSLVLPLKQFVATLKGEELPWYSILTKTVLFSGGSMQTYPMELRGVLNYSTDKDSYASLYVFNENGLPVCEIKSQWLLANAPQHYSLAIPIKGLLKGKYTVQLKSAEKSFAIRTFEI